ncbi:MAG TPA: TldD/PmbA family protein [Candidatus Bathyarchaeia archaeon]|nr:TldD/PmbA family protein [Candidatus Bathyarchaeia archaeon]
MHEDSDWSTLSSLVNAAMERIKREHVSHAEAFYTSTRSIEVSIRNSEIFAEDKVTDAGVGFRVIVDKDKVGFASTNMLNERAILEAGKKAMSIAKASPRMPNFALPDAKPRLRLNGLFDPEVAEMTVEEAVEVAERTVSAAESLDNRVTAKDGRVSYVAGWRGVKNTLGVECEEQETRSYIFLWGNGRKNGEVTSGCSEFEFGRGARLHPEAVGENMARRVISLFEAGPVEGFEGPVIFGPEAVSYQLFDVLVGALISSNVISGRSVWNMETGSKVASDKLTVIDNAVLKDGFASRSFDDEGFPSQVTVLVDHGRLESFLHHAATAKELKTKNTGNASRYPRSSDMVRMITGIGYRTKPEVYPSNLVIKQGDKSQEKLVSEMETGVLVEAMAGFAQQGSGLISAQLSRGFWVQHGEIQHAIKSGMVLGIAFDWLKQISAVGSDSKQFANSVVPSLKVENVKVVCA